MIDVRMKIKVALAQFNSKLGDVTANLEKHLKLIEEACQQGADLIIFPELIDRLCVAGSCG